MTTDCRATPDKCNIQSTAGHFAAVALNMNDMLSVLSNAVDRVVVDRTGLQGSHDIDIDWAAQLALISRQFYSRSGAARTQAGTNQGACRCLRDRSRRTPHTGLANQ